MKAIGLLALVMVLVAGALVKEAIGADYWTVATISTDSYLPDNITFLLDGDRLYLNNTHIYQPGGSSAWSQTLHISGTWAVCGSADNPDPFASFVLERSDAPPYDPGNQLPYPPYTDIWTELGYIRWSADTPADYTTQLLLGVDFVGNGATSYEYSNPYRSSQATGTLVLDALYAYSAGYYNVHDYKARSYGFTIHGPASVPEPTTTLLTGSMLLAAAGLLFRRRNAGSLHSSR
jgi:hypothetical protein